MLVSEMVTEIQLHIHDVSGGELTAAQILTFIQSAARDYRATGWLLAMEDDESLTVTASTPEYNVPASFAFIQDFWLERTVDNVSHYDIHIPRDHWTLRINGSVPVVFFYTQSHLETGKKLKIVGQKRPTIYVLSSETVDVGLEFGLRERALAYALLSVGFGESELARLRLNAAGIHLTLSPRYPPGGFRMLPSSKRVPGRQ